MGRIVAILIVVTALAGGAVLYWLQVYGYYRTLPPEAAADLVVTRSDGMELPLPVQAFRGIDAVSSPIRYRACFTPDPLPPVETLTPYPAAEPLIAPGWFDCFDATAIGAALADGSARAMLGQADVHYGIDRVVAVMADGRAYAWHQINACGRLAFEGKELPDTCPPAP
jgi:Family of unknown function (DUF6446)